MAVGLVATFSVSSVASAYTVTVSNLCDRNVTVHVKTGANSETRTVTVDNMITINAQEGSITSVINRDSTASGAVVTDSAASYTISQNGNKCILS